MGGVWSCPFRPPLGDLVVGRTGGVVLEDSGQSHALVETVGCESVLSRVCVCEVLERVV